MHSTESKKKTAVIVAVQLAGVSDAEHLQNIAELARLTHTLGYEVVGAVSQRRGGLRSAAVLAPGKLKELAAYTGGDGIVRSTAPKARKSLGHGADEEQEQAAEDSDAVDAEGDVSDEDEASLTGAKPHADMIVVDHEISPRQARNLETATQAEVIDRTGVIVEIFHRHANTREARLQVEIARLAYVVPRLRAGVRGSDRGQGGVGGRGAGESSLELDKRKVRDRIAELKDELDAIGLDEDNRRSRRQGVQRVGLVGYTNAGKSSLMRALTGSEVLVQDKLFATLGTTVRALTPEVLPRILISDTVGFIKKLPHDLVASFRSTLHEALEASLLLYVVDSSDPAFRAQLEVTHTVLAEIGAETVPSRLILNKIDLVDPAARAALLTELPDALQLSAKAPADVARLRMTIIAFFEATFDEVVLTIPFNRGQLAGDVRKTMRVLEETHDEHGTHLRVRAPKAEIERVRALL